MGTAVAGMTEQREDGKAGYGHEYEHHIALRKGNHLVLALPNLPQVAELPLRSELRCVTFEIAIQKRRRFTPLLHSREANKKWHQRAAKSVDIRKD